MSAVQRAQMSNSGGLWRLYLVVWGAAQSRWPEFKWAPDEPIPTPQERSRALADLGYEVVPGYEWEWCEGDPAPDSTDTPVQLIASVAVSPIGGAA